MQTNKRDFWTPGRRTALKPASAGINSGALLLILILASRQGQLADVAAYTAGASVGAIASAVLGSGTSLAYVTGDGRARTAVRRLRYTLVAPSMFVCVAVATLLYTVGTELQVTPILIGGIAVVLNNLAELESASLERLVATPRILLATVISRTAGLVLVLLGGAFSWAMLLSAALGFACLRFSASRAGERADAVLTLRESIRLAYAPSLMLQSLLGVLVTRALLVVLPFVLGADEAGAMSAMISAQQSLAAILVSGLYTLMAAHSREGERKRWMVRVSDNTIWLAVAISVIGAGCSPVVVWVLGFTQIHDSALWWVLFALAIVPFTINRKSQYSLLARGSRREAAKLLGLIAALTVLLALAAVISGLGLILAAAPLVAEGVTCVSYWGISRLWRAPTNEERSSGLGWE